MDIRRLIYQTPPPRSPSLSSLQLPETPPYPPTRTILPSEASTQSWDSRNGPRPDASTQSPSPSSSAQATQDSQESFASSSSEPINSPFVRANETSRDKRLMIKTALLFKIPYKEIIKTLHVTDHQIWWVKHHRLTPQKSQTGRHNLLRTPEKTILSDWFYASPSHRHIPWSHVPHYLPQLHASTKAISTAFRDLNFCRRVAHKKGFSDDPRVIAERLAFAEDGITWRRDRVQRICFTDEVWAMGGAHTDAYVTVKIDGSDRLLPECLRHKYSKGKYILKFASFVRKLTDKTSPSLDVSRVYSRRKEGTGHILGEGVGDN